MKTYYIPNGPKNLEPLFPTVDFSQLASYYIEVKAGSTVIATTPTNYIGGECCNDKVRIRFLNYLGAIDAINFKLVENEHETTSDSMQKPVPYPLVKKDHAGSRFNVKANDTLTLSNIDYKEENMKWFNELLDSPLAWMQWKGIQGQADTYIPVVILNSKMSNVKQDDRFYYEVKLSVRLSHEKFIIRN